MKKISCLIALSFIISANCVLAHPHHYNRGYYNHSPHYYHSGCSSNCVYIIKSDNFQEEQVFKNCSKHTLLVDGVTNYYSNGAVRTYYSYTVLNQDKTPLITNCSDIKHLVHNKKHYFLAKQNKYYKIIDDKGFELTKRKYTSMKEIAQNKLLVKVDKKYGIIDIFENIIVPIKYQKFEQLSSNLFKTKLNGYWGLVNSSGNILLKNEFDNIKLLYDTYIAKRANKYYLLDLNGETILSEVDKIKKLGEYILIKKDKKYGIFDFQGKQLSEIKYKKIKLERNELKYYQ